MLNKEPAVVMTFVLGAITSILTTIGQAQTGQITWWAAAPVLAATGIGMLVRFGVVSPATAQRLVDEAKADAQQIQIPASGVAYKPGWTPPSVSMARPAGESPPFAPASAATDPLDVPGVPGVF